VTTLHGRLDIPELFDVYRYYSEAPVVSISDAQRGPLPELNWVGTIHHGLPAEQLRFNRGPGKYLAFLGRIAPEKRPDIAIEVARRVEMPLKIAAKVDAVDREYFESKILPLLKWREVEFIGEIGERDKSEFLGNAIALVFPIEWPEPFGLVMIEAMACGTPVIARPCGSVPEVLRDGVPGFTASSVDGLAEAVRRISVISRQDCRAEFEARFTADVMAAKYEELYYRLIEERRTLAGTDGAGLARGIELFANARERPRGCRQARRLPDSAQESQTAAKLSDFYILAPALIFVERSASVLVNKESFAVFEVGAHILKAPYEPPGFFHRYTRYLKMGEGEVS
jgi:Glycosyl transferases group 1